MGESTTGPSREELPRIEAAVAEAVGKLAGEGCPPRLAAAIRHATLGGGNRLRPRLLLAVCRAVAGEVPPPAMAAATALELVHCASLVHDDLPCFDDAPLRRGAPSVHRAFGEAVAVLAGDALILGAFELLGEAATRSPEVGGRLVAMLAAAAGSPRGITAGQGWESEPEVEVGRYHQAKTASLFELAAMAGALCGGAEPGPWRELGRLVGRTYQVADDVRDLTSSEAEIGKPVGRDQALGRPSAVRSLGLDECLLRLDRAGDEAVAAIPGCPGQRDLAAFVSTLLSAFRPK